MNQNRYPVHSLTQALDRLGPRSRAKYDDLKALLADSEALQRSLMERIKTREERLADLMRRHSYASVSGDAAEATKLDRELAAVHADLDRLERERSRRNGVRANVEQVVSRLNNFIGELFSGTVDVERPPWPNEVPTQRDGESIGDALMRLRHEINIAQGELQRLRAAPPPASEIKAAIAAEVDRMAGDGTPHVTVAAGKVTVHWPDQQLYASPGSALSAPSGSASKLLAALFPEQLKRLLTAGIVDTKGAIASADRPRLIRDAEARILGLEIGEERLVMAALDAGLEVHRRIDSSPWAILFAGDAEAVAEAAE
jgi:hypothetical protein